MLNLLGGTGVSQSPGSGPGKTTRQSSSPVGRLLSLARLPASDGRQSAPGIARLAPGGQSAACAVIGARFRSTTRVQPWRSSRSPSWMPMRESYSSAPSGPEAPPFTSYTFPS